MNRNFTFILMLLAAMCAGRGMAAISTNAAPVTNAAPANAAAAMSAPEAPRNSGKVDFDSFKLVRERNIFDMSRTGRIGPHSAPRVVHVDDFTLVGTMSYEKGLYAFFDGSSSEYRQARKTTDKIADFKISKIANDFVELENTNGKTIKMGMGATIRREDKGPWLPPTIRSDVTLADSGSSNRDMGRSDRGSKRSDRSDSNGSDSSASNRSDRRLYRSFRGDRPAGSGSSSSTMGDPGPGAGQKSDSSSNSSGGSESDVIKRLMEKRAQQKGDQ